MGLGPPHLSSNTHRLKKKALIEGGKGVATLGKKKNAKQKGEEPACCLVREKKEPSITTRWRKPNREKTRHTAKKKASGRLIHQKLVTTEGQYEKAKVQKGARKRGKIEQNWKVDHLTGEKG